MRRHAKNRILSTVLFGGIAFWGWVWGVANGVALTTKTPLKSYICTHASNALNCAVSKRTKHEQAHVLAGPTYNTTHISNFTFSPSCGSAQATFGERAHSSSPTHLAQFQHTVYVCGCCVRLLCFPRIFVVVLRRRRRRGLSVLCRVYCRPAMVMYMCFMWQWKRWIRLRLSL